MRSEVSEQFNIASWFIDRPAEMHPERIAIAGEPQAVTYGELSILVNRAGNVMRSIGCTAGGRVLIVLPDSVEFVAAFFGAARIGAVAIPVNPFARVADFSYYVADSAPQAAIVHALALPNFLAAVGENPLPVIVVGGNSEPGSHLSWEEHISAASPLLEAANTKADDPAFFLYTSGSTGTPKAAIHQHKNMLATSRNFGQGVLAISPSDRTFSISKLFFAYGLGNGMYFPLSVGASTILNPERPSLDKVAELVKRHRPTLFFAVPTFYRAMLEAAAEGLEFDFSSVRVMVCAGESLSIELFEQFYARFGFQLVEGIGSTEMLQTFISNRPDCLRAGTCGVEVPGYEAQLIGENGAPVSRGEIGTLHIKGESRFAGYWNQSATTAKAKAGEWVITGDKFYRDADGFYHFCGRNDDMVKIAGMWVLPLQIQAALQKHPQVEKAVIMARDLGNGEKSLVAYVASKEPGQVNLKSLRHYLHDCLPEHMVPRYFVALPEFPLMANGKINRQALPLPTHESQPRPNGDYVTPHTSTERELSNIWSAVLEVPQIGSEDDFIDLGGTSVTGIQCISRIKKTFGIELPLETLLADKATLKTVAAAVDKLLHPEIKAQGAARLVNT